MKIERAVREKTFTLTSIAGPSGSGKTYSAILYARGLVGPEGKIGFIDTENKRSRFYADVGGGFDVIDLDPPFTSARYVEAINAFQDAGYTAIIIDSVSHEWEGTGGVLEQAEAIEEQTKRAGLHCWKKPKGAHKRLMNELLQTKAHLIFCCRVKEKVVQVKGEKGKTEIVNQGFVVVQEKSFIYEMTVSMMLEEGTHIPTLQKCPDDLVNAFSQAGPLTIAHGNSVRGWADKGVEVDPAFRADRLAGLNAANLGTTALQDWWKGLTVERKRTMESLKDTFKSVAAARDLMAKELAEQSETLSDRLGAALGGDDEGFNADHVARETNALANPKSEPSAGSPPSSTDEGTSDVTPPSVAGATLSADEADAPAQGAAGQVETGATAPETNAVETGHGGQPASVSTALTDADRAWLLSVAKQLWPSAAVGEQELVTAIAKDLEANVPAEISVLARKKEKSVVAKVKEVCFGEKTADVVKVDVAAMIGCEPREIAS